VCRGFMIVARRTSALQEGSSSGVLGVVVRARPRLVP
jgi:hypothetical protein